MSDGPNKDQNEKPEQSSFEEAANKEAREKAAQHEKEEGEIHQEGVHKRTGSKLEMMERMNLYSPDTSTAANVDSIDTSTESDEEVQSSLELLGTISISILAKMFEGGIEKESVDSLPEFKQVLSKIENESQFKKLREKISNVSEKATFNKLQEILKKPASKIYKELDKHWNEYIGKSKKVIGDAEKGHLAEAWKYVRKNPGKVVFAVAGAFALHGLYKAFVSDESKESGDKPWHKKIFNKSSGMALGLMALGAILDSDKIMAFANEYLTGETKETVIRGAENAKQAAVDALNRNIGFDEKKNKLATLLGKDSDVLEGASLATILDDLEIQPEKTAHTEPFKGSGGAAKLIKKWLKKKGKLTPTIEKILDKFIGEDEAPTPTPSESNDKTPDTTPEKVQEGFAKKQLRFSATATALTNLYCIQDRKLRPLQIHITHAFDFMHDTKVKDIMKAYHDNKASQEIPLEQFNIESSDFSEAGLYHAAAIVTKAFETSKNMEKKKSPDENQTLGEFFLTLGDDPAIEIAGSIQESIMENLSKLNITSPDDLLNSVDKVFDSETIEKIFNQRKEEYIDHLSEKFNIDTSQFTPTEKAEFYAVMTLMYAGSYSLNQSKEAAQKFAENNSKNPKVIETVVKLTDAIKTEVTKQGGLLQQCIDRYDIKTKDEKYNQILKKNLKADLLYFRDGFQMVLLSEGISFGQSSEIEGVGQAKDISMIYLILHILKNHKSADKAYTHYAANLIKVATNEIDLDINVNFKFLQPYFSKLFDIAIQNAKDKLEDLAILGEGIEELSGHPNKIEKIHEMDAIDFAVASVKYGAKGFIRIPRDLVLTLMGQFPDLITPETTGEEILKMVLTLGGTISYPQGAAQAVGLIYLGGKYFFCKPIDILADTFMALPKGPGTTVKTYLFGTSPFVVFGATWNSLNAWRHGEAAGEILFQGLSGAGRGLTSPISLPTKAYRWLRRGYRAGKYYPRSFTGKYLSNFESSMHYFSHYNDLTFKDSSGLWQKGQAVWKEKGRGARKFLYNKFYKDARFRWAEKTAISYNDFWGINPETVKTLEARSTLGINYTNDAFFDSPDFIQKLHRMNEVLEEMKKIENMESLSEAEFWKKMDSFLEKPELDALKKRAGKNFEGFRKALVEDLKLSKSNQSSLSRLKDAARTKLTKVRMRERMKKLFSREKNTNPSKPTDTPEKKTSPDAPEKAPAKVAGETTEVLKDARKNLETVRKEIKAAESEIKALNDVRKSPQFEGWDDAMQKRLTKAREVIANGREAELKMQKSIQAFENVQEIEGRLAKAVTHAPGEVSALNKELQSAKKLAEESLQESTELAKNMGKASKLGRVLKYGGGLAGGLGAIFSFANAGAAGYEALTTDVEGRGTVKGIEAGLWTINAAADTAAVAVLLGAEGAAATGLSAIALPLIPITYVGVNAIEAAYEETTTDYEWIQKNPYEALHHFYTTMHSISVGDIYLSAARLSVEKGLDEHQNTMHKIYRGLVATQKDPSLLNYILDVKNHPPSDAKNKEIEKRIEANYSIYHEMYFQSLNPYGIQNYQKAQQVVLDAQMFDRIMSMRDKAKEAGQPFVLGNEDSTFSLDLCDPEFDMVGGMMAPSFKESKFLPQTIVDKYKEDLTHLMKKDEILWTNLERMDTAYLLRLCAQMQLTVNDPDTKLDQDINTLMSVQFMTLKNYLEAQRGVNFEFGIRDGALFEPRMSMQEILENIHELGSGDMEAYYNFEKQNYNPTPSTHALFRLAEYLGFTGEPTEIELKGFFSEGSASFRGIYWDGENWYLQERGHEFDDNMGPDLNEAMIKNIIEGMRDNPDDILEHRNDAIFLDALDYTKEVNLMAEVLEKGLAEGKQRGYKEAKSASESAPPTAFQEKTVDYEKKEKDLASEYKEAINHVKEECNWSRLKYRIVDDNTIKLSRTDSNTSVKLTRSGDEWNVGGYKGGLTLSQAIVLGNLKNKVEKIIVENDHSGGSDAPFENDGGSVDFDRNWNPNDLRILDKDKGWLGFYDEIGISVNDVVEVLNSWYKNR